MVNVLLDFNAYFCVFVLSLSLSVIFGVGGHGICSVHSFPSLTDTDTLFILYLF